MTSPPETPVYGGSRRSRDPIAGRIPFFYGWVMLPLVMIAFVATTPGQTYGISAFNTYLKDSLRITDSQLTGAYMLGTLLACLPMSLIGALMDRHGIRRTMAVVVILFGCACIFISRVNGLVSLFFAFLFLRMFGQGAMTLLASNTLAMWFHSRLGRATGMTSLAMSAAIGIMPGRILALIEAVGWRDAYVYLGLAVMAIMLPLLAVLYRDRPEDVGQLCDGVEADVEDASEGSGPPGKDLGQMDLDLRAAIRTRAYWIMLAMSTTWALVATGIFFNIIPLMESHGLTEEQATDTYISFAICMALMNFVGGLLADRLPLNLLLTVGVVGMTAAVGILIAVDSAQSAHAYSITFGAFQGIMMAAASTLWARYYGRAHLGKIRGTIMTTTVAGSSAGPFVMGFTRDLTGSYDLSLWVFLGMFACLSLATPFATRPKAANQV